jgi:uncharacterized protein
MNRERAILELGECAAQLRARGATALYLYGSTSREDATAASDVDLFIDYDPEAHFNAFDLIDIKSFIEERLHAPVDLTKRDGLHPRLRDRIERDAIQVF